MDIETEPTSSTDEQEFLVYVDFEGNILPSDLDDPNMDIHIIGIETEHPVIEINGKIFEGTHDFSIGTNVFFEKDDNPPPLDPLYDLCPREMYKLFTKTNKVLKTRRMLVESNQINVVEDKKETFDELKERLQTDMSYKDALNLLLPPGMEQPKMNEDFEIVEDTRENSKKIEDRMDVENTSETDEDERNDPDYIPFKDT